MKKVAIVNRTNLLNYGSVLQVLALAEAVNALGYEAEVIWEGGTVSRHLDLRPKKILTILLKLCRYPRFIPSTYKDFKSASKAYNSDVTASLFKSFVDRNIRRRFYSPDELKKVGQSDIYYKYICGSDQIWCTTTLYPDPLMYLRFAKKNKRIAYAPSLGRSYIPDYNRKTLKRYINDMRSISVREIDGAELIEQLIGKRVQVTLDPTLLFEKKFWESYFSHSEEKDYILCYFLNEPSIEIQTSIINFAKGRKIIGLRSQFLYIAENYDNLVLPDAGPSEFLSYVNNADFIFTDSYHGILFSINFEKEFLSVERDYGEYDQSTRQRSILRLLGIEERYSKTGNVTDQNIDYTKVKTALNKLRQASMTFLQSALTDN